MKTPHRRRNPLTGDWVFVSPQRNERPWLGQREAPAAQSPASAYDPGCYLCPGNRRAGGERNPPYTSTYAFANDFPAFLPEIRAEELDVGGDPLFGAYVQRGLCRVLCFSPRHDLTLAQLSVPEIRAVVELWVAQAEELSRSWRWVQLFENKGASMGASNPHPHGQVWASDFIPTQVAKELREQQAWRARTGEALLVHYAREESRRRERTILESSHWLVVIPWWALWPYETLLMPRCARPTLGDLVAAEREDLAATLKQLLMGYDALFSAPFPYSFGWHGAPSDAGPESGWQLHAHIYPPLLRSATVRKFMVGYEMFAEGQRDLTPEEAAERLRRAVRDMSDARHPSK